MHFQWLQCILLAAILGSPLEASARAIRKSLRSGDDASSTNNLLRRIKIPGVEIPGAEVPEVALPKLSNAGSTAGNAPHFAPEPNDSKPASSNSNAEQKPCKRADSADCAPPSPGSQDLLLRTIAEPTFLNYKDYMEPLGNDGRTFVGELPWKPDNDAILERPPRGPNGAQEFNENLKRVTQKLWENLPDSANKEANLVATLFVPGKGVWFSSIPHGAGDTLIFNDKVTAPAWYARSKQEYDGVTGDRRLGDMHAEDGAIYQFEKSQGHSQSLSAEQAQHWKFPPGTRLAVYGKYSLVKPKGFKGPCQGVNSPRQPGCLQLISRLGITQITF